MLAVNNTFCILLACMFWAELLYHKTDRHPFNGLFFQDNLGKLVPERLNYSEL